MKIAPPSFPLKQSCLVFLLGLAVVASSCRRASTELVEAEVTAAPAVAAPIEVASPLDELDSLINQLLEKHQVPGISMALLTDGQLHSTKTYGLVQLGEDTPISTNSMFSVGSVSKVGNALLTLRLVEEGLLDLDTDVNTYLKDWQVAESQFTRERPVTLRTLLSHTAGCTVHGFDDFLPEEELPTTLQILQGSGPAKNQRVYVDFPVGSRFRYSGGGITVIQAIIEAVTDLPYHEAAHQWLFAPLGMERSSYQNPLPASFGDIAKAHDRNGQPTALPRGYESMPEAAASGLWTTPSDLASLLTKLMSAYDEEQSDFLSRDLIEDMISPEPNSAYGLGPEIEDRDGTTVVYHDGANNSYRAHFKLFWQDRSGYVVFTNGNQGLALIRELLPHIDDLLQE